MSTSQKSQRAIGTIMGLPEKLSRQTSLCSVFVFVLVVLLVFYFFPIFFEGQSLYFRDLYNAHYPLWTATARFFQQEGFPLWNPLNNFGQNISGNPNYLIFYPPAWIRFLCNPVLSLNLFIILHLFLGGLSFYFLCHKWRLPPAISFWGGLIFPFCGVCLSLTCVLNLVPYIFLFPAILVALEDVLTAGRFPSIARLALLLALVVTVFEPIMATGVGLAILGRLLLYFLNRADGKKLPLVKKLVLTIILAIALCSPALYESARLVSNSHRSSTSYQVNSDKQQWRMYSLHPFMTEGFWIPNPFRFSTGIAGGYQGVAYTSGCPPFLLSMFIGFSSLLLIAPAFWDKSNRRWAWLACLAVVLSLLLAWGNHIPGMIKIMMKVPLLNLARFTEKNTFFSSFALLFVTLSGLTNLGQIKRPVKWSRLIAHLLPVGGLLVMGTMVQGSSLRSLWPFSVLAGVITAGVCLFPEPVRSWIKPTWAPQVVGLMLLLELLFGNHFVVPNADSRLFTDPVPILSKIETRVGDLSKCRVAVEQPGEQLKIHGKTDNQIWVGYFSRQSGLYYTGMTEGTHYAFNESLDELCTEASYLFEKWFWRSSDAVRILIMKKTGVKFFLSPRTIQQPQLSCLGCFDNYSNEPYYLYEVTNPFGRVTFTKEFFQSEHASFTRPDAKTVGFVTKSLEATPPGESVDILRNGCNRVDIQINTERSGLLVLHDTYYPGWRAWDNGQESQVFQVDYCFRGVILQPGHHIVSFQYRPHFLKLFLFISVLALLVILVGMLLAIVKERRDLSTHTS